MPAGEGRGLRSRSWLAVHAPGPVARGPRSIHVHALQQHALHSTSRVTSGQGSMHRMQTAVIQPSRCVQCHSGGLPAGAGQYPSVPGVCDCGIIPSGPGYQADQVSSLLCTVVAPQEKGEQRSAASRQHMPRSWPLLAEQQRLCCHACGGMLSVAAQPPAVHLHPTSHLPTACFHPPAPAGCGRRAVAPKGRNRLMTLMHATNKDGSGRWMLSKISFKSSQRARGRRISGKNIWHTRSTQTAGSNA